jgi:hypothetical protein
LDSSEIAHTPAEFVPVSQVADHERPRESAEWLKISKLVEIQRFRLAAPVLSESLLSETGKGIARLREQLRPTALGFKLAQQPSRQLILRVSRKFGNPRECFLKKSRHVRLSSLW